MRRAGAAVARVHEVAQEHTRAGLTTGELDERLGEEMRRLGAEGLFRGYRQGNSPPFPGQTCISINEEVVHGVPGERQIRPGDLVSVDVGLRLDGWCADAATSILVPVAADAPREERSRHESLSRLVEDTRRALHAAIERIRPGVWWSQIARGLEEAAGAGGYAIVTQYVGHGIGRDLHEPPKVPAFVTSYRGKDFRLEEGLTIAIEPMFTLSGSETDPLGQGGARRARVRLSEDRWTVTTLDAGVACHEELLVAVGGEGAEVLTRL